MKSNIHYSLVDFLIALPRFNKTVKLLEEDSSVITGSDVFDIDGHPYFSTGLSIEIMLNPVCLKTWL
jgi:hypothetical protein